ncbi:MAG: hypothetical protein KDC85_10510 [Saprospiraceae bacterium]|nr:hypothetical protein [Saprospiraceae bacterium]MCB9325998.1 hypothetical protein [Lewinellaceae bacterium]
MFEKFYTRFIPVAKGRYIWPGIVLIILFNTVFFPLPPARFLENNTLSGRLLDLKFSYNAAETYALIDSYGAEGRTLYWKMALVVDNPYAVVYGISFMLILIFVLSVSFTESRFLKTLAFLPILAALFDLLENGSIAYLLISFPVSHVALVQFASFCTSMKWISLVGAVFLLIYGAAKYLTYRSA